jgi:3-deoxy-D-manno-octulosonic-acid transferase
MGRLSDLYSVADLAWVGGAIHAKVHNVLEPAAWGVPISCGPRFQNSQEAVALHDAGLLFVPQNPEQLRQRIIQTSSSLGILGQNTKSFAQNMSGASDKVLHAIFKNS